MGDVDMLENMKQDFWDFKAVGDLDLSLRDRK